MFSLFEMQHSILLITINMQQAIYNVILLNTKICGKTLLYLLQYWGYVLYMLIFLAMKFLEHATILLLYFNKQMFEEKADERLALTVNHVEYMMDVHSGIVLLLCSTLKRVI